MDPIDRDAPIRIKSIEWEAPNGIDKVALGLGEFTPLANIDHIENGANGLEIWPARGTTQPQMQLLLSEPLDLTRPLQSLGSKIVTSLEISTILLLFAWLAFTQISLQRLVVAGMALAAGLILAMLVITGSKISGHPDEFSHLAAYDYYVGHVLPPAVDDPATIPSTSVWGTSYLSELDVVYELAAQTTAQLRSWTSDNVLSSRLFQLSMWLVLCVLAACRRYWALTLSVGLLSPQIWYAFAYFNADAFPLFLSLIAAGLIADENNGLHRFLRTGDKRSPGLWVAAICIGLLLVSKRNYLPVVPALLIWLAVVHLDLRARIVVTIFGGLLLLGGSTFIGSVPNLAHWHLPLLLTGFVLAAGGAAYTFLQNWKDSGMRAVLLRLVAFTLICICVATPRVAWDMHVNGWPAQKAERMLAVVEARAGQDFKPSIIAQGKGDSTVGLASRGVPLGNVVLGPHNWASRSLSSAFGVYGYMNIFAPPWLYLLLPLVTGLITLLALNTARKNRPQHWQAMAAVVIGGGVLVLASSLLFSWILALEPQGRYLFPMFPLGALLIGQGSVHLPRRAFALLIAAAFSLSAYSFVSVALLAFAHAG